MNHTVDTFGHQAAGSVEFLVVAVSVFTNCATLSEAAVYP